MLGLAERALAVADWPRIVEVLHVAERPAPFSACCACIDIILLVHLLLGLPGHFVEHLLGYTVGDMQRLAAPEALGLLRVLQVLPVVVVFGTSFLVQIAVEQLELLHVPVQLLEGVLVDVERVDSTH